MPNVMEILSFGLEEQKQIGIRPTEWISTEQDAGGEDMVFVILAEVIADDQRRRHVYET